MSVASVQYLEVIEVITTRIKMLRGVPPKHPPYNMPMDCDNLLLLPPMSHKKKYYFFIIFVR